MIETEKHCVLSTCVYGQRSTRFEQINSSGEVLYYHHDQQGSTRLLTNQGGKIAGTDTYGPYGNLASSTGTKPILGYDGQYTDPTTGLIYLRARWYDPGTAQFLTRDPLEALTGEPYAYAADDPMNASDPTGLLGGAPNPAGFHEKPEPWLEAVVGFVKTHPEVGLILGGVSLLTGAGAVVGVGEALSVGGEALGAVSVGTGAAGTAFDAPSCLAGESSIACIGLLLNGTGGLLGGADLAEELGLLGDTIPPGGLKAGALTAGGIGFLTDGAALTKEELQCG